MKETKMYISNLPKSCSECPCTHEDFAECNWCQAFDNGLLTFIPDEIYSKERLENCPLQTIKQHDRELVKEVCERIKEQLGFIIDGQERIVCDGSATGDKTILAVLKQTQKEYEK